MRGKRRRGEGGRSVRREMGRRREEELDEEVEEL